MNGDWLPKISFVIFAGWLLTPADAGAQKETAEQQIPATNQTCLSSEKMIVFQIIDEGILAHVCPTDMPGYGLRCQTEGDMVFLPVKPQENDYVDEQKVTLPANKCFVADGVFSYYTRDKKKRRVRKIKIIDAQPDNP